MVTDQIGQMTANTSAVVLDKMRLAIVKMSAEMGPTNKDRFSGAVAQKLHQVGYTHARNLNAKS